MEYNALPNGFYPQLRAMPPRVFKAGEQQIKKALRSNDCGVDDFQALLAPQAQAVLEDMARQAHNLTLRYFGRSVQVFAPLYLANICTNSCLYCGFHAGQKIARLKLDDEQIEQEAKAMAAMGLRSVLLLTGDAPHQTGADYIARAAAIVARHVPAIGIEVQALTTDEYAMAARAGVQSMTMFQETYNQELYAHLHPAGPKRNFTFRLDAPQRAAMAGMRSLTLGALLGLGDWRRDIFCLAMHACFLNKAYPHLEIAFSLPRIRPRSDDREEIEKYAQAAPLSANGFDFSPQPVSDADFVQALLALRCFLPHAGITISSREPAFLRDRLLPLGVTKVSAGVRTMVGGYVAALKHDKKEGSPVQFVIDDTRSVEDMCAAIRSQGYQPVMADWLLPAGGDLKLSQAINQSLGCGAGL